MWSSTTDVVPKGDFIELAPEQAELFAREIVESARLFSSGDVAGYREFVEERRVEAGVFASQENAEAHWNRLQRSYSGLVLDGSNIVVLPWKIGARCSLSRRIAGAERSVPKAMPRLWIPPRIVRPSGTRRSLLRD